MKEQQLADSQDFFSNVVPCSTEQIQQMEKVRNAFVKFDEMLIEDLPESVEQEQAREKLKGACSDAMQSILNAPRLPDSA